jgi:hypothetical protein
MKPAVWSASIAVFVSSQVLAQSPVPVTVDNFVRAECLVCPRTNQRLLGKAPFQVLAAWRRTQPREFDVAETADDGIRIVLTDRLRALIRTGAIYSVWFETR